MAAVATGSAAGSIRVPLPVEHAAVAVQPLHSYHQHQGQLRQPCHGHAAGNVADANARADCTASTAVRSSRALQDLPNCVRPRHCTVLGVQTTTAASATEAAAERRRCS